MRRVFLLVCACSLVGCGDSVVGEWENEENDTSIEDIVTLESDGTGEQRVEYKGDVSGFVELEIDWENVNDQEYELDVDCSTVKLKSGDVTVDSCADLEQILTASLSVKYDCELRKDDTELRCEAPSGDKSIYSKIE